MTAVTLYGTLIQLEYCKQGLHPRLAGDDKVANSRGNTSDTRKFGLRSADRGSFLFG